MMTSCLCDTITVSTILCIVALAGSRLEQTVFSLFVGGQVKHDIMQLIFLKLDYALK
jgi:hypothetical protein